MVERRLVSPLVLLAVAAAGCGQEQDDTPDAEVVVASAALHGPPASARRLIERANMVHGVAAGERVVFVSEPLNGAVAAHDRDSGRPLGLLPPPPGGFLLPFTLRVPREGRVVVLDAGGFPSPGSLTVPRVYDYDYRRGKNGASGAFEARLVRSVRFDGLPVGFTEDFEVLDDGSYVVSDSILGSLWMIGRDGAIAPGIVPDGFGPGQGVPALAPCTASAPASVGGIPFALVGNFAPGVGSLAADDRFLYFANSCRSGIHRVPLASLRDTSRPPAQRGDDVRPVSPGPPGQLEVLKGLTFNRFDRRDRALYVADPFRLRLLRIDVRTGAREALIQDEALFNFPVAAAFLPPCGSRQAELVVASDQEHRFAAINAAIPADLFQPPFLVTRVRLRR